MSNSYRPDPNRTHTEAVAQAIWRAAVDPRDRDMRTWRDVINKAHYRHLAEVAIEAHTAALGLTEEWGWQLGDYKPHIYPNRAEAQARVDELNKMFEMNRDDNRFSSLPRTVVSRRVTRWVAVPDSGSGHE